ncbi:MAG: signal recognition particle receptor subunit alpha, partial [Pseudomonas sp.]
MKQDQSGAQNWAARLKQGLARTRTQLSQRLAGVFGGGKIDETLYQELETILLVSDIGAAATSHLLEQLRMRVKRGGLQNASELKRVLQETLLELLVPLEKPLDTSTHRPFIIMVAGVNGSGKT